MIIRTPTASWPSDLIAQRDGLGRKIEQLEKKVETNSAEIGRIFEVIEDLLGPAPPGPRKRIGFSP